MTQTSAKYEAARDKHGEAIRAFDKITAAYRAREIETPEYLTGRKIYEAATAVFDAAFEAEADRRETGADEV